VSDWIPVALLTAAGVAFWHWCRLLWDRYNTRYHYTREEWRPEPWPDPPALDLDPERERLSGPPRDEYAKGDPWGS
jgi:hypothetical protein